MWPSGLPAVRGIFCSDGMLDALCGHVGRWFVKGFDGQAYDDGTDDGSTNSAICWFLWGGANDVPAFRSWEVAPAWLRRYRSCRPQPVQTVRMNCRSANGHKDQAGTHHRGNGHTTDRVIRGADQANDTRIRSRRVHRKRSPVCRSVIFE